VTQETNQVIVVFVRFTVPRYGFCLLDILRCAVEDAEPDIVDFLE